MNACCKKFRLLLSFFFPLCLLFANPAQAGNFSDTTLIEQGLTTSEYLNYALELQGQLNFNACFDACQKVLAEQPQNAQALAIIAHSYRTQLKWDSCILYGTRAFAADTVVTPMVYRDLVAAYTGIKDWNGAIAICRKTLLSQPDNSEVKWDISESEKKIREERLMAIKMSLSFFLMVLIFLLYYLPRRNGVQSHPEISNPVGLLEILISAGFVTGLLYFIFFLVAPTVRSMNTIIPTQDLAQSFVNYSYEHDGMEGQVLYAMTIICVFAAYALAFAVSSVKNRITRFTILLFFIAFIFLFLIKTGFYPPVAECANHIIPLSVITLSIIAPLYFISSYSWKLAVALCAACLVPISFIAIWPISIFDAAFIQLPALRILHGAKLCDIYFQYDLLLSLISLVAIKLNMPFSLIQYVAQLSIYALFLGLLLFSRRLFYNKNMAILLLAFVVIVRFYANLLDLMYALQATPMRLDLWFILLVLVYWKTPYHWSVGLAYALMLILHRNFGYIYLAAYLQLLFILFMVDIGKTRNGNRLFAFIGSNLKVHLTRSWKNLLLIASGLIISDFLFGGLTSTALKDYSTLGFGMTPVSTTSFYWYVPILLGALVSLLLIYRKNLNGPYFANGLFLVLLCLGNSIYFLGRSHENNLLNLSAVLALPLYMFFDLAIFTNRLNGVSNTFKSRFKAGVFFSLPFIAVLFAAYYYGARIDFKVKAQYANMLKGELIRPLDMVPYDSVTIKTLTHNSSKVYFLDYQCDFLHYYYGNYSPPGYFNPSAAIITKKEVAAFVQKLLDDQYCIVCRHHIDLDDIASLINYNRMEEMDIYIVIEKLKNEYLLKEDTADILHLSFKTRLSPYGLVCKPLRIDTPFVIQCVVKPDSLQAPFATILDNSHSTICKRGFYISQAEGMNNNFVFVYGDDSNWISSGKFKLEAGQWNLLSIAMDSNDTLRVFVNGVMLPPLAVDKSIRNSVIPLTIGNSMQHDKPFRGMVRELKIITVRDRMI